jgi:primosomal protein N' (replication factor Y)
MIAKIAVAAANFAIDKPYSYFVPLDMKLAPGMRVQVPFGRGNRQTEGVVLQIVDGDRGELKAVERCLDEEALLSDTMLHLAAFLRERYFCTFFDAIRAMPSFLEEPTIQDAFAGDLLFAYIFGVVASLGNIASIAKSKKKK